jgi:hypothetical protein
MLTIGEMPGVSSMTIVLSGTCDIFLFWFKTRIYGFCLIFVLG